METDDFRESFLFHNLSAIWAALNWLFSIGRRPVDIVGGSWGGVHSLLLAALDDRIEGLFSSFGCGGFCLPGVEKRSMWDAAFEHMGPARAAAWCRAFDPLLRMQDIAAGVYYETATNDKFFSLDMAMETWRRVRNPVFLGLLPNRDHDMRPFGVQPYVVQAESKADIARCRAISEQPLEWDAGCGEATFSKPDREPAGLRLFASEQLPGHGDMSREWVPVPSAGCGRGRVRFALHRSDRAARVLFFATGTIAAGSGATLHAATPIQAAVWPQDDRGAAPREVYRRLLDPPGADPDGAPIGDKCHPAVRPSTEGWTVEFAGVPRSRATRFGIRPWLLPPRWETIEVTLAAPADAAADCLDLVLSRRYQRLDEEAVFHPFRDAAITATGNLRRYRFERAGFSPGVIVEERFRRHEPPPADAVLDDFDAVGIVDCAGRVTGTVVLVAIAVG
jgi:hypothetical protein